MTTYYMHTLDGKPAAWDENHGGYIYVISEPQPTRTTPRVHATSLGQIRREQHHDATQRAFSATHRKYGYIRFTIEGK